MKERLVEQLRAAIRAVEEGGPAAGEAAGEDGLAAGPSRGAACRGGEPFLVGAAAGACEEAVGIEALLRCGGIHEWFGTDAESRAPRPAAGAGDQRWWVPPLGILLHLVCRRVGGGSDRRGQVVWIGRWAWPNPQVLLESGAAGQSVFVDPPDAGSRLWAIDVAVRCPAVAAVVADGSGLDMAATRRLQLAAEWGSALVLMARPPREMDRLSAATTRWLVRWAPSPDRMPRWIVQLLRCKGRLEASAAPDGSGCRWIVPWSWAGNAVGAVPVQGPTAHPASATSRVRTA
jgi:hypothetical protein